MTTRVSPSVTRAPSLQRISLTTPSAGDLTSFSIFIASRRRRTSPRATVSPGLTLMLRMRPAIWARTPPLTAGPPAAAAPPAGALARAARAGEPPAETAVVLDGEGAVVDLDGHAAGALGGWWRLDAVADAAGCDERVGRFLADRDGEFVAVDDDGISADFDVVGSATDGNAGHPGLLIASGAGGRSSARCSRRHWRRC